MVPMLLGLAAAVVPTTTLPAAAAPTAPAPSTATAVPSATAPPPATTPPAATTLPTATAAGDPRAWLTPADYPPAAPQDARDRPVLFTLTVDAAGAVTSCTILQSSGVAVLDSLTCDLLRRRARFVPPRGVDGAPAAVSTYTSYHYWAAHEPPPSPLTVVLAPPAPVAPAPPRVTLPRPSLRAPASMTLDTAQISGALRPATGLRAPAPPAPRRLARYTPIPVALETPAPPVDVADNASPPADSTVHYGHLANGMAYALMHSPDSLGTVAIRLQIGAGSLDETGRQRGYAHMVEHMLFRGSTHVADGQFAQSLERMGLGFGTDTTANTGPETTVFGLDFPPSAAAATASGLFLLREAVDRATIAPAALASERGVVLSEQRVRDTVALRSDEARTAFLLAGQPIPTRWTGGTAQSISDATAAGLRAYYEAHYRPETTMLVMAGNLDPALTEGQIGAYFADWAGKGAAPAPVDQGHVQPHRERVRLFVEAGAPSAIEAHWLRDYDRDADTLAHERRLIAERLATAVLNLRLARLGEAADAPFVSASLERTALFHSAIDTRLSAIPQPDRAGAALAAIVIEQRRLVRFGIAPGELDVAIRQFRADMGKQVANAGSRAATDLANDILAAFNGGYVFATPAQTAADCEKVLATLTPAEVNAAAARMFAASAANPGTAPLVFASASAAPAGGAAGLRAALAGAEAQPLAAGAVATVPTWPYTDFGPPGRIVKREDIADIGVTIVHFANGTSLTLKTVPLPRDQIQLALYFGAGMAGVPPGLARSYWQIYSGAQPFVTGGLGKIAASDINAALAGQRVGISFGLNDARFALTAESGDATLDTQLQLLAAYVADPGFRPAAFAKALALGRLAAAQSDASPADAAATRLPLLLGDGDSRWRIVPTADDLAAAQPSDLAGILRPALGGPLDLVIVGDVPIERAIAAVQATIGALPPRGARPEAPPRRFPAPPAQPLTIGEHGPAGDALAVTAWRTPAFFGSTPDARAVQVLAQIIQGRLIDGLREKDGVTYSPTVTVDQPILYATDGVVTAQVDLNPAKTGLFFATMADIVADLARTPVSLDELNRARAPMIDEDRHALHITNYWLSALAGAADDPRLLDMIRSRIPDLAAVKPADIQRLAQRWLAGVAPYRVVFAPAGAAAP